MTPFELKAHVGAAGSHFFDEKTMSLFGDTMENYRCARTLVHNNQTLVYEKDIYILLRAQPVKGGIQYPAFFDCETFEQLFFPEGGDYEISD